MLLLPFLPLLLALPALAQVRFTDQTAAAGITLRNTFGGQEKNYIVESHGSGAAFIDCDNDGDLDLYAVNGATFETYQQRSGPGDMLYRNEGGGRFADISAQAGVGDPGWGGGAAVGDIDNDGWHDLYITNWGPNTLYHNQGKGRFADISAQAGVAGDDYSASAAFFDYDNDGDLDLYVTNYVIFDLDRMPDAATQKKTCVFMGGVQVYCGPKGMPGAADALYRNESNLRFTDVSGPSGIAAASEYYGLGVVPEDFDLDGHMDLYVANDETPNLLFHNNGDGTFTDIAMEAGVAYNGEGDEEAGMGIDAGDCDNDGDADLHKTNFFRESNTLYRNEGNNRFSDVTSQQGLAASTLNFLGWGTKFADFDRDGDLDLFVANGHVYPQVDQVPTGSSYRQRNQFFLNQGKGRFTEVLDTGPGMKLEKVHRGAAFGDYDNDGDMDVYVSALNDLPTLLRNDTPTANHWLTVQVFGAQVNRDGAGTRLHLVAGGQHQWRTINGAASYLSHNDLRAHFGLGGQTRVDLLELTWPDGSTQALRDLPADKLVVVRQGNAPTILEMGANPHVSASGP
ncbi:MAG: CRTAC1 family protein [Candidatus Handelsmanbacteria bacterium]|nr:CRTAC1 family protein [Candidatus Handelsmanbacteria bacterium]